MPFTGFTITVKKSEVVDLNITLDQAFQFIVSCGVVAPPPMISAAMVERSVAADSLTDCTRGSALALWQANWVADRLRRLGATVELVEIVTSGDKDQRDPILEMGQQGVFTKEIQAAVINGAADHRGAQSQGLAHRNGRRYGACRRAGTRILQ